MSQTTNRIRRTDCIAGMNQLQPGSVDLVFADPPFNIGYDYDVYEDKRECDAYLDWSREWMHAAIRALKPSGTFWIAIGDEYAAEIKLIAKKELGLTCRSWVIWYYTFGVNCTRKFSRSHAHLFHFVKDAEDFTFNDEAIRIPSARQLVYNDKRANPKGRLPDDTWILRPQDLEASFGAAEDTWHFPRVCGTFKERAGWHGCQMPEQLLGRIIRCCSNPGEVVLDPFAGSGTTLAVAKKLDRAWLGFDISEQYIEQIQARMRRIKRGASLEGAPEPRVSAPATPRKVTGRRRRATSSGNGRSTPPDNGSKPASAPRRRALPADHIIQAYRETCAGFSIDRVLADPGLGGAFDRACRDRDLEGDPAAWRHRLIGLRKAGKLEISHARRKVLSRAQLDPFEYAGEIAWALVANRHHVSLDEILCNPPLAAEFDAIAAKLAPGQEVFHYRWAALALRKQAMSGRRSARVLPPEVLDTQFERRSVKLDDHERLPEAEGLYLLSAGPRRPVYLGWPLNLRARARQHRAAIEELLARLDLPSAKPADVRVRVLSFPDGMRDGDKKGLRALLLGKHRPPANALLEKQAFVASS